MIYSLTIFAFSFCMFFSYLRANDNNAKVISKNLANLSIKDIDIVELNEAFASQSLACIKDLKINKEIVNIDGGAIALGHPLGATGTRITAKAAQILKREQKRYALATQCIGLGQGIATILELV